MKTKKITLYRYTYCNTHPDTGEQVYVQGDWRQEPPRLLGPRAKIVLTEKKIVEVES